LYAISKTPLHRHWGTHVAAEPVTMPIAPVRTGGTTRPQFFKWGLWAAGIVGFFIAH